MAPIIKTEEIVYRVETDSIACLLGLQRNNCVSHE